MSEYERVQQLRIAWAPKEDKSVLCITEPPVVPHQYGLSKTEEDGIRYQRCGGGRRVIRKKIRD